MKLVVAMFGFLIGLTGASAQALDAVALRGEIRALQNEISGQVRYGNLTAEQLVEVRNGLRQTLASISIASGPSIICLKSGNQLYYPANPLTGKLLIESYMAGAVSIDDCRKTLPQSASETVACYKQSNGMFYPSRATTGKIMGSDGYQAGHVALDDCRATLPATGATLTCFKSGNSLYYPTNSQTGAIVGSSSYGAGSVNIKDCLKAISQ